MSSETNTFFTSYISDHSQKQPSVSCINCRLEQSISIVKPYPNHKFSRTIEFNPDNEKLKFGDFIKQVREVKCRKCNEIIYCQVLVKVMHEGWFKLVGTIE